MSRDSHCHPIGPGALGRTVCVLTWDEGGPRPGPAPRVFSKPELATSRQWGSCNLALGSPHSVPACCVTDEVDPNEPLQAFSPPAVTARDGPDSLRFPCLGGGVLRPWKKGPLGRTGNPGRIRGPRVELGDLGRTQALGGTRGGGAVLRTSGRAGLQGLGPGPRPWQVRNLGRDWSPGRGLAGAPRPSQAL